ncbi:hypothetical protein [Exiguobacterium sp. MH3]|uniref:hypothetical protein n=1 Tax=Exiguobacterium sp. MH3 TaxID=1399115 RepID=UPI0003C3B6AB|nr:hypothetical protein [Exiguobacterium sp. MH3]AHA31299.1 hypothetical protein U719_06630 [Exiguobacterium sp. MH3]
MIKENEEAFEVNTKTKYFLLTLLALGVILGIPYSVGRLMECSFLNIGSLKADSWMSFWGGYLGAILGIIGAITITTIQISSQTNQIVLAAKENDKLERKRINLNLKIEKNVELFKYLVEIKSTLIKYDHLLSVMLDEQTELIVNYSEHNKISNRYIIGKFERNPKLDQKNNEDLKWIDQIVNNRTEKINFLKNELNQSISSLQALSTNILANRIFINNNNYYYKILEVYMEKIQRELFYINIYIQMEEIKDVEVNIDIRKSETKTNLSEIHELEQQAGVAYTKYMELLISQIENSENKDTDKI